MLHITAIECHVIICVIFVLVVSCQMTLGQELNVDEPQKTNEEVWTLFTGLLDGQNPRFRPVRNMSEPITVSMRLTLYQILDVDEKEQSILVYMWGSEKWKNDFAYWDPAVTNGVTEISYKLKDMWVPDTYLYNGIESTIEESALIARVKSSEPGYATITHLYPAIYKLTCSMYIRFFPYDIQHCRLHFGSWSFDMNSIDYVQEFPEIQMEPYLENSEFSVVNVTTVRESVKYSCCEVPFAQLYFNLVIKRKPLYYIMNVIFPTVIIATITIFGFFCPSQASGDRGEKITLGMTSLFAMSVYLLIVAADIPTTSDLVPLISIFYIGIIVFITAGTLVTALMITLEQRGRFEKPVPEKLRRFVVGLGQTFCCYKTPDFMIQRMEESKRNTAIEALAENRRLSSIDSGIKIVTDTPNQYTFGQKKDNITKLVINSEPDLQTDLRQIELKLKHIIEFLKSRSKTEENRHSDAEESEALDLEWEWCVNVLEQCLLWSFFIILIVFVVIILIIFQFSEHLHYKFVD